MSEMKKCPFCGGRPELKTALINEQTVVYYVTCLTCGAIGPTYGVRRPKSKDNGKDSSIKAWNQRK